MASERITNLPTQMIPNGSVPARSVTISTSAINLINTTPLASSTSHVQVTFTGGTLRYTIDGSTPSASVGHQVVPPQTFIWPAGFANRVSCIRESTTDAVAYVSGLIHL